MKRRLFNLLAAVSLVLCVAMVVLWVRSYSHGDVLCRNLEFEQCHVISAAGTIRIRRFPHGPEAWNGWELRLDDSEASGYVGHPWWFHIDDDGMRTITNITAPMWVVAVALLSVCLIAFRCARRRVSDRGLCPNCGYDLRATPQRCPECGAIPADAPRGKIPA